MPDTPIAQRDIARFFDQAKFLQIAPGASRIFEYIENHSELKRRSWTFDEGAVERGLQVCTSARFWAFSETGLRRDQIVVKATQLREGTWRIQHRNSPVRSAHDCGNASGIPGGERGSSLSMPMP